MLPNLQKLPEEKDTEKQPAPLVQPGQPNNPVSAAANPASVQFRQLQHIKLLI
eukprot:m.295155 g.295155  ORF g.295155 m.295155 type:complete len:53 (+) comp40757_c0_seq38:4373-4531(+)